MQERAELSCLEFLASELQEHGSKLTKGESVHSIGL